jgi:tetratricopeptide (TPR) repeat protein
LFRSNEPRYPISLAVSLCLLVCSVRVFAQSSREYADPKTCAGCHDAIARRYAGTGMAQSFGAVRSQTGSRQLTDAAFYHAASAENISVTVRDGAAQMERHQSGFDGSIANIIKVSIDYWFGSGNHARSYFSRTNRGELTELPITWYSEHGGYWAMSPGYDSASHGGFSRKATYRCMFCHNAYPDMAPGADRMDNGTKFPEDLPSGIDCQRCHGPGLGHVNAAIAGRPAAELKSLIVNPAGLPAERRDEVCLQCHLEPTSMSLPAYLPVYGRGVFSYGPGQPLDQYIRFFDHAPATGHDDKFEFSGAPYRLRMSKCFTASQGALTCITCHDPHEPEKSRSIARASAACVSCHRDRIATLTLASGQPHPVSGDCVSCHMPERRPSDAIHVTIRDHYIQRDPVRAPEPIVELNSANTPPYRGEVVPYYPRLSDIYTAIAQVKSRANPEAGITSLEKAIAAVRPPNAEFYSDLADAYRHAGNSSAAIPYYKEANSRDPEYWPAWHGLGLAMAATGDLNGSLAPLRRAVSISGEDSSVVRSLASILTNTGRSADAIAALRDGVAAEPDSAELHNDLGTALYRAGDLAGAEASMREAVRLRPESAAIRLNLASLLARRKPFEQAEFEFRAAIRTDPAFADGHSGFGTALASRGMFREAREEFAAALKINPLLPNVHNNLGAVLKELGDEPEAAAEYREAIRIEPGFATARYNLAVVLESQKKLPEAGEQLLEAIRLEPRYFAAHLKLGEILIAEGKPSEALPHLRQAAGSPDRNLSARASALMKRVAP